MKRSYLMLATALLLLLVAGCAQQAPTGKVAARQSIKIGIMTITSGDLAFLGEDVVAEAQLALAQTGRTDVQFIVEDVGSGDPARTVAAYRKLVDEDGVQAIIDVMLSDDTLAVTPLLEDDKVVMITPGTGGGNLDAASPYFFRNGPSDVMAGVSPAMDLPKRSVHRLALITDNAAYTLDIREHFLDSYAGEVVLDELVDPYATDYRTVVTKLANADVDAVMVLSAAGRSGNYIIRQMHELGIDLPIYLNFFAFNGDTEKIAGQAAEGVYVYEIDYDLTNGLESFLAQLEAVHRKPTYVFHVPGVVDDIHLILEATDAVGYEGSAIRDYWLKNVHAWPGLARNVTFDAHGNDMTYGFRLAQIHNGTLVTV